MLFDCKNKALKSEVKFTNPPPQLKATQSVSVKMRLNLCKKCAKFLAS